MLKIVTLTMNPTIDKSAAVDSVAPEVKLRCDPPRHDPGGGGINVSRAIHKMGGRSVAVYPGGGPPGQMLRSLLDAEDIEHHYVPINNLTRESLTVFERSTTKQYRFGMPGPELRPGEWERCLGTCLDLKPDILVASGSLPPGVPDDFYARLAVRAQEAHVRLIVDTSGPALRQATEAGLYLIKPNLRELEIFCECEIADEQQLQDVAGDLIARGMAHVILVSMGRSGAAFITANGYAHLRAPLVQIRSKVGAGDSMVGGIALGLAQGRDIIDAARLGVAAGTAAVMTEGTQLCEGEDVERLYDQVMVTATR